MNDFLLECTDGDSLPENGSVDGGNSSSTKFGALSKREIEDFFRDTSSSSSSPSSSSSCPSTSSSPWQQQHRHPNQRGGWGAAAAGGAGRTPGRDSGGSATGDPGEGEGVQAKKSRSSRHGGSSSGGDGHHHRHQSNRERLSPLPPHMRSLPKKDRRWDGAKRGLGGSLLMAFFFFFWGGGLVLNTSRLRPWNALML